MNRTCRTLSLSVLVAAQVFGCSSEGLPEDAPPGESSTSDETTLPSLPPFDTGAGSDQPAASTAVATLHVGEQGEDELRFSDIGGSIAIVQLTTGFSYLELMESQGGTPLELYMTFAPDGVESAPEALWHDHAARTERTPAALDTSLVEKSSQTLEPRNCATFNVHALAQYVMPNGCHTDAGSGIDEGHASGRSTPMTVASDAVFHGKKDTYLLATCHAFGTLTHEIWVLDAVFGWQPFDTVVSNAGYLFGFFYTGEFARPVAWAAVVTPYIASYKLESFEICD